MMSPGFRVFKDVETPLYVQVADSIRGRLIDGSLRVGDRLPSVRSLSDDLGVNPATIVAAYRILASEGFLESRAGSGAYVAATLSTSAEVSTGVAPFPDGYAIPATEALPVAFDLAQNAPPRRLYPLSDIQHFLADAVALDDGAVFDYQDASGYRPLKEILAARLRTGTGPTDPCDVHIVSGAQQGLDLVARTLLRPGDTVVVESPGYRGAVETFIAAGARILPLPVGPGGLDVDSLERAVRNRPVRLVYVNPGFQNPTGCMYDEATVRRLALLAARNDVYIVEDDQVSELGFDGAIPPSVANLDASGRVFHIKGFSKTIMPGLRIAGLAAPPAFRERLEAGKRHSDLSSSGLMQRVLERLLATGRYDARLPGLRDEYRRTATLLRQALADVFRSTGAETGGGLSVWMDVPPGLSGRAVAAVCRQRGLLVVPEAVFRHENGVPEDTHIRLTHAALPEPVEESSRLVAALLREATGTAAGTIARA